MKKRTASRQVWEFLTVASMSLLSGQMANGELRTFHSSDGKPLQAELVSKKGLEVTLKLPNGRKYTLPIARLSPEDQLFVRDWKQPLDERFINSLEIVAHHGLKDDTEDYDNHEASLRFTVKIKNPDSERELTDLKGKLVVFGQSILDRNERVVFQAQEFPIGIPPGKTLTFTGKEFHFEYDETTPSEWGHKYDGYVLTLTTNEGEIIRTKSNSSPLEKNAAKLMELKPKTYLDRNLDPKDSGKTLYFR